MSSTVIDHAIAIPTKQRNVWEYISDISKFPLWHVDVQSVSFLTTKHDGRGTRYRVTTNRGKAIVIEITAWYEGLGYEYIIVDGSPFENNRGRIRLQESTEGTIVQWTFSYELTGFLSGLRNSLTVRRGIDNDIIDNLRNLYTYIKEVRGEERFLPEDAKSYLKEAPDVIARSQYAPRYPSKSETKMQPVPQKVSTGTMGIVEPPVAEEDTKPNKSIAPSQPAPYVEPIPEPTFLKDIDFKRPSASQVKPEPLPRFDDSEIETETVTVPAPAQPDSYPDVVPLQPDTPSVFAPVVQEPAREPILPDDDAKADAVYTEPLAGLPTAEVTDSSKISVFEVFGLPKPSETEKLSTIQEKPQQQPQLQQEPVIEVNTQQMKAFTDATPIVPDVEPEAPKRTGLRASLRRRTTRVRLPK
jgi:uncharacterized membrane protein